MENYYKKIVVAGIILLHCSITFLNADLLNGPYSTESQELVKLAQNKAIPIPKKFKNKEKFIKLLRTWVKTNNVMEINPQDPIIPHDTASLQAAIGVIKSLPTVEYLLVIPADQHNFNIAILAGSHNNSDLFTAAIKNMGPEAKNELVYFYVPRLFNQYIRLQQSFKDGEGHKKYYNFLKHLIEKLITHSKKEDLVEAILRGLDTSILSATQTDDLKDPIDFLLTSGFPINFVSLKKGSKKLTLLDTVNSLIQHLTLFKDNKNTEQEIKNAQALKDYLISQGAKTYAELNEKNNY